MKHLTQHWHHYAAIVGIVLSGFILGVGSASAYTKWKGHGFVPGPLPPTIKLGAGVQLPAS
jgi:hypothetical protein